MFCYFNMARVMEFKTPFKIAGVSNICSFVFVAQKYVDIVHSSRVTEKSLYKETFLCCGPPFRRASPRYI